MIRKIKDLIFLYRANKNIDLVKVNHHLFFERALKYYRKDKKTLRRNLLASLIKKLRKISPYRIQDFSKAKALYDSITPIDLSKIVEGTYVVKFSKDEPVKGDRWCEYYINYSGNVGTYKVTKWKEKYRYWQVEDYRGDTNTLGNSLNEDNTRSFRLANEKEIHEFIRSQEIYRQKKREIELKQKEIENLYREL